MKEHDESGFTLIELIIVVAVLGIVMSAIAASLIAVITTTGSTASRVSQSHDAQLLATYLVPDLQSATGPSGIPYTAPPSGFEVGDCPPTTPAAPPAPAVVWSRMGSLRLSWADAASGAAYEALYAVDTTDFVLRRAFLRQVTDAVLTSSTTVTSGSAGFVKSDEGAPISGAGIPANTRITQVKHSGEVVISSAATASSVGVRLTVGSAETSTASRQVADGDTTLPSPSSPPRVRSATAAFSGRDIGAPVSGAGIRAGTFIVGVNSATEVFISEPAATQGSGLTLALGATATSIVVHNLENPSSTQPLPPGATRKYPVCYTSEGNRATLTVNTLVNREGNKGSFQYAFEVSGETRTPFGPPPSTAVLPTMLTSLVSEDIAPQNGKVDSIVATFNQSVACTGTPSCDKSKWKVTGQPGAAVGTVDRIVTSANTVALSIQETGTIDTRAPAMKVELSDGSVLGLGGPASFLPTTVQDSMPPSLTSARFKDVDANGKIDSFALTFSEVLTVIPRKQDYSIADAPAGTEIVDLAPSDPSPITVSAKVHTLPVSESTAVDTVAAGMRIRIAGGAGTDGPNASLPGDLPVEEGFEPALDPAAPLVAKDLNGNGKTDQIVVSFTEPLGTPYNAPNTVWTLTNPPSGATLSSVTVAGNQATLNLAEGSGPPNTTTVGFTIALASDPNGIRDTRDNQSSFPATGVSDGMAPALDPAAPPLVKDTDGNGKADQVLASFTEALATPYGAPSTVWTLTNAPSAATVASVAVAGKGATLTLTEGADPPNTSTVGFRIALSPDPNGVRDARGNQSSFAEKAVGDDMAPVLVAIASPSAAPGVRGKIEPEDMLDITFSEPLATVPSIIVMAVENGADPVGTTFKMPGLVASLVVGSASRYTDTALSCNVLTSSPSPNVVRITVQSCLAGVTAGSDAGSAQIDGAIRDSAGNAPPMPAPTTTLPSALYF